MNKILKDAKKLSDALYDTCDAVHGARGICALRGRPITSKQISLSNVREEFNESIQSDFVVVYIRSDKDGVFNIIDLGTNYSERTIGPRRDATEVSNKLESEWTFHHGVPTNFRAEPEFTNLVLKKLLSSHEIHIQDRPARLSSKNGKV